MLNGIIERENTDLKFNRFAIQLEVCSDEYLPIRLDLSSERTRQALSKSGTIFVKKRTSYKNKVYSSQKLISQKSVNSPPELR